MDKIGITVADVNKLRDRMKAMSTEQAIDMVGVASQCTSTVTFDATGQCEQETVNRPGVQ